jgi:hypothetical protein
MAAHENVQMSIEQDTLERFRQGVREVDRGINPLELDEVVFNPLLDCKMTDIHVTGTEGVGGTVHWYRAVDAGTSRVTDACVGS